MFGRLMRATQLGLSCLFVAGALAVALEAQEPRPDQVFARAKRSNNVLSISGVVTENRLTGVVVAPRGGEPETIEAGRVVHVELGDVPADYHEGLLLFERGDLANAAAKFKLAATDEDARDVVRAAARLRAAEALLRHGATDPSAFAEADTAATRFLEDYGTNREVPRARFVRAQAQLCGGDMVKAAEEFRSLYREAASAVPTEGYDLLLCYRAGLRAADAYLMQDETLAAREIYQAMEAALPGVIAGLAEDAPQRAGLLAFQAEARLGEGFVLLASGSTSQARSYFEEQDTGSDSHAALRFGVKLGLGLVHIAEGDYRRAQVALASVTSIDYTDRDRTARALTGLAEAALGLPDSDGGANARIWLQSVMDHYPDSIWVRRAQELIGTL